MSDATKPDQAAKADATKPDASKAAKTDAAKVDAKPEAEKPPMHIDRLKAFKADPNAGTAALAYELLTRTGPLVLDGEQYRVAGGRIRVKDLRPDPEPEDVAGVADPDLD